MNHGNLLNRPGTYPMRDIFGLPWSLRFDRDGTEDIAYICSTEEKRKDIVLASSGPFWFPEYIEDTVCRTLASMQLMVSAPRLLQALHILLSQTLKDDSITGVTLTYV